MTRCVTFWWLDLSCTLVMNVAAFCLPTVVYKTSDFITFKAFNLNHKRFVGFYEKQLKRWAQKHDFWWKSLKMSRNESVFSKVFYQDLMLLMQSFCKFRKRFENSNELFYLSRNPPEKSFCIWQKLILSVCSNFLPIKSQVHLDGKTYWIYRKTLQRIAHDLIWFWWSSQCHMVNDRWGYKLKRVAIIMEKFW